MPEQGWNPPALRAACLGEWSVGKVNEMRPSACRHPIPVLVSVLPGACFDAAPF